MDIPVGQPLSIPAQVVATDRMPPTILSGTVTLFDGAVFTIGLPAGAEAVSPGDALVLDLQVQDSPLVQGRVSGIDGTSIQVRVERSRPREPREFPRVSGDLVVRCAAVPVNATSSQLTEWVGEGKAPGGETHWHTPARLLDWSAAGLGFEDDPWCEEGDRLLLDLVVAAGAMPALAVGRVVRVAPLREEEPRARPDASHRIAVDIEIVAPEVRESLLAHTIERQRLPGESDEGSDTP